MQKLELKIKSAECCNMNTEIFTFQSGKTLRNKYENYQNKINE